MAIDKESLVGKISELRKRLRWAGLTTSPYFVQLCEEGVESNANRIDKLLEKVKDFADACILLEENKDLFPQVTDESLQMVHGFWSVTKEISYYACECLDFQLNFLLLQKNAIIAQSEAEIMLIYRHVLVDVIRADDRLDDISRFLSDNQVVYSIEKEFTETTEKRKVFRKKYKIKKAFRDERNEIAAHYHHTYDYLEIYNRIKNASCKLIGEICSDMYYLADSYLHCFQRAMSNYLEELTKSDKN